MIDLEIQNLSKRYGSTKALDDLSLSVEASAFIAILGPSGCGKTTLLRSIAGFVEPSSGSITFQGKAWAKDGKQLAVQERELGMVFQQFALWPHMTVLEHLLYPLNSKRNRQAWSPEEKAARIAEVLDLVELSDYQDRFPSELSGGQKQRVAFARAIVAKPRLLLMDEPLSALDAHLKESMLHEIKKIHQITHATILYVTHDQKEAMALADRILVLKEGKVEQFDTPYNLYHYPASAFVANFVGKAQLVHGFWQGSRFYPSGADRCFFWNGQELSPRFHACQAYPVHPEDFIFSKEQGLPVQVIDKQFLGRDTEYLLRLQQPALVPAVAPAWSGQDAWPGQGAWPSEDACLGQEGPQKQDLVLLSEDAQAAEIGDFLRINRKGYQLCH